MGSGITTSLNQKMIWRTRGENCVMCNALRGRVYTYDMWMSSCVWPGFHEHCDCYLQKVGADYETSDPDFFGTDIALNMTGWFSKFPILGPYLQLNFNWEPLMLTSIREIEQAHMRYGPHLPIGEALKRMRAEFQGFFKRSPIWDAFFQWRLLKTVAHYQSIDGTYSGYKPPGFRGLFPKAKTVMPKTVSSSSFTRNRMYLNLNNQLKPDDLRPYTPSQSYHYGSR